MTSHSELVFMTKDVLGKMRISESVYKKYIKILEESGMMFQRNQRGHRIFSDEDMTLLERFIELSEDGMTLQESANFVVLESKKGLVDGYDVIHKVKLPITRSELNQRDEYILTQMREGMAQQNELINQNHQVVMERLDERDQLLLENVRQLQEVKKLTAASKEKKWWEFWK